ncbi:MAG TPA: restriction endonuclease [Planktothrix sp. UBA8402]|nr:restriction endonuclease [Planktothrix sp. UBA8402]
MDDPLIIYEIIQVILSANNSKKQELGRRFAARLGLTPGVAGPDDGIDGFGWDQNRKIHFQCKLRAKKLDKDDARMYYSDIDYHCVDLSVMLAGSGYKDTFIERLYGHRYIDNYKIYLLTLDDIFQETPAFEEAVEELPPLRDLGLIDWKTIK